MLRPTIYIPSRLTKLVTLLRFPLREAPLPVAGLLVSGDSRCHQRVAWWRGDQHGEDQHPRADEAEADSVELDGVGRYPLERAEVGPGRDPKADHGPDADRLNQLPKVVFSRTLKKLDWANSRLVNGNIGEEVTRLKQQPGKDLALFDSANLAATLIQLGLIDEYRVLVTPVILGVGTPMFKDIESTFNLKLLKATTWSSGTVALWYRPAR